MKKLILVLFFVLIISAAAFSQDYIVQEISGRVEQSVGGKWEALKAGDVLGTDTVIRTGIGARLMLKSDDQIMTVGAAKNGKISDLVGTSTVIQLEGKISVTDTSELSRTTGRDSTASARASTASAEIEIEE